MSKWLDDHHAIALIRDPRKVSEAVAVKLLVEACAEGLVRAWQRACCEPKGFGLSIPAFVWRDAHFADGLLFEAGTDMYTHPGEEGGYGYGVNGIIEFNAEDLHYWLNVAPTPRRQRSAPKGQRIKEAIDTLYPDGVPPQKDLPNPELIKRVGSYLKEHDYNVSYHNDLILRQAGRKAKRSRPRAPRQHGA
jgi:hypothetical protein